MELKAEHVKNIRSLALCKEKLKVQTSIAEDMEKMAGTYHTSYAEAVKDLYEKNKAIRRQKYKRCLAMAKWCEAEVRNIRRTPLCDMDDHEIWQHDDEFWQRWHTRWFKIAEQFKEDK